MQAILNDFAKGAVRWGWAKIDGAILGEVGGGSTGNVEVDVTTGEGVLSNTFHSSTDSSWIPQIPARINRNPNGIDINSPHILHFYFRNVLEEGH